MLTNKKKSYTHVLAGDFVDAMERLQANDNPINRRNFIRAAFSAIDGLLWALKQTIFEHATQHTFLSIHEKAALSQETYTISSNGAVKAQPRFLPMATLIRLTVHVTQRFRPNYNPDFEHVGWQCLKRSIDVRNRIIHPKNLLELTIKKNEITDCIAGFLWFLALAIDLREEVKNDLKSKILNLKQQFKAATKQK